MANNYTVSQSVLIFGCVLYFLSILQCVDAAHSVRRPVVRSTSSAPEYDRSITTFNPRGRLLQVEYGMEAANRGDDIIAVASSYNKTGMIIVLLPRKERSHGDRHPIASNNKMFRLDDHLYMVVSGLGGDSLAMAAEMRVLCQNHQLVYGEKITVTEAAGHLSSLQHRLTRQTGARPFGCTAILVGFDSTGTRNSPRIYRSTPGGTLEDCLYACAGQSQRRFMNDLDQRFGEIKSMSDQSVIIANLLQILSSASKVARKDNDHLRRADVWVFEPSPQRRGRMRAVCFLDASSNRQSIEKISEYFSPDHSEHTQIADSDV